MTQVGPERWLQVGGALFAAGCTLSVAYLIYVLEADEDKTFWSLPGWLGLTVTGIGLIMLLGGFFARSDGATPTQHQSAGNRSRNYQAGRDISMRRERESGD